jgi:hypothetical protein
MLRCMLMDTYINPGMLVLVGLLHTKPAADLDIGTALVHGGKFA